GHSSDGRVSPDFGLSLAKPTRFGTLSTFSPPDAVLRPRSSRKPRQPGTNALGLQATKASSLLVYTAILIVTAMGSSCERPRLGDACEGEQTTRRARECCEARFDLGGATQEGPRNRRTSARGARDLPLCRTRVRARGQSVRLRALGALRDPARCRGEVAGL